MGAVVVVVVVVVVLLKILHLQQRQIFCNHAALLELPPSLTYRAESKLS